MVGRVKGGWSTIRQYRWWVVAVLTTQAVDVLLTKIVLGLGAVELNPIMSPLIESAPILTLLVKVGLFTLFIAFVAFVYRAILLLILKLLTFVGIAGLMWNAFVLALLT